MGRLEGRRIIITGAASGIGRAGARLFAEEGARLLLVDLSDAVHETARLITEDGGNALALTADVADEATVRDFVARCVDEYGGLDAIHANAGILESFDNPIFDQQVADWERVLRVNLIAPFLAIKHAGPQLVKQGKGSIVLTASVAGLRANAGPSAYSASKAGVISLAQTAANALLGTGVRVNAICPGLIETGMTAPMFDSARSRGTEHKIGQLNPLQRGGRPEEIARMALFLVSDDSSYVNGQAFAVDGGLSSTLPFMPPRR